MNKKTILANNQIYQDILDSSPFLKSFLENSDEAIAVYDLNNGIPVLLNDKVEDLFKCSKEELILAEPLMFVPEFQPNGTSSEEMARLHFSQIHKKGKINYSWQQKAADGSLFHTSITAIKVVIKNFNLCIIIHKDITQTLEAAKNIGAEREQFKFLFNNIYDGILIYDLKLQRHVECNERLLSYFEIDDRSEILNNYFQFSEELQWNNIPLLEAWKNIIEIINQKGKHRYNWIHRTKKGRKVISEITTVNMSAPNEHIRLSIFKDITNEKIAIAELERSRRELLHSQSIAKMASFRYDVENDHLAWSAYAYQTLGMDPDSAPTDLRHFISTIHEDDRKEFVEILLNSKDKKKNIEREVRVLDQQNNTVHCHLRAEVVTIQEKLFFIGSVQDITEQKLAIQKISQTNSKYIDLFDNMYDALLIIDKNGNFNDGNFAAERLLGYSKEELKDMKIADIVYPEDKEKSLQFLEKLMTDGFYSDFTGRLIRKDGDIRHVQVHSTAIYENGEFAGSRDIARDITNIKVAEAKREELVLQLEKVNLELKNFAYLVSHDLKAPLRAISSLASWLIEDYKDHLDQPGLDQLGLLFSRANRMHNFIDAILEYSKIGRTENEAESLNLNEVIKEIELSIQLPKNFKILVPKPLPKFIGDRTRMTQLFQNLISNSVKYNDKQQGEISILWEQAKDHIKFNVCDNGPGINKKDHDRIFQIFQTLQSRDEIESTGIGLTIVKRIVNLYQGKIKVESEEGKGLCLKFELYESKPKDQQP